MSAVAGARESLAVVHLVWAPLGPTVLERFISSYRDHEAGVEHRLLVLLNGFAPNQDLTPWTRALGGVEHEQLRLAQPVLDLAAYREAVERLPAERYVFVNSFSVIRGENWLGALDAQLSAPHVGVVGTAGSWESAYSGAPRPLRPFRRGFDPFPNPHIRTNGFAMTRELLRSLEWRAPGTKLQAWELESGRRGLSRQVADHGLAMLVVGRDGIAYPPERWRESETFRSGEQANQLIADNRTEEYARASPRRRVQLERLTWGLRTDGQPAPAVAER